ncbi:hypothetical protein RclHR1_00580035 [Rhizophagus clarus]|uniref:SAM domain-containing protein n=1 Tax=Rhizophagus clarus TaxID=94130 RepID=A0A2Z6S683_9GLOM|nr:hypothetical protein RclHR1_00580035 [Rhizophagus clarus]GES92162.1 hypothetical protein GLOIN_2v1709121 [Rhizophagus clarus]
MSISDDITQNETVEDIKKFDNKSLIKFLKKNTPLKEEYLNILCEQDVDGYSFLHATEETFLRYGLKGGPATFLVNFAKKCREEKKNSSYKTIKDLRSVLEKFGIDSNRLVDLPQFTPPFFSLTDEEVELQQCITEIKCRLRNMGPVISDSNEALRNEFVSPILHAALNIVRRITNKEIVLYPRFEIMSDENTGRVEYGVKSLEELICITESKQYFVNIGFIQNVVQCESALQTNKKKTTEKFSSTSKNPINIKFSETALTENSEEELELSKNVKRVLEVIVGLLKDKVEDVTNSSF